MALDHIAPRAGVLIVYAAMLDAGLFGHGDLHMVDVAAVPERIRKTKDEDDSLDLFCCSWAGRQGAFRRFFMAEAL
jgi:hypothetical protein